MWLAWGRPEGTGNLPGVIPGAISPPAHPAKFEDEFLYRSDPGDYVAGLTRYQAKAGKQGCQPVDRLAALAI